jgi:hypothetical protein
MRYQDQIAAATMTVVEDLFRSAHAMPEDKLNWTPLESKRSVINILQECAQAPNWFRGMLITRSMPDLKEEDFEKARAERAQWETLDECERICRENTEKLCAVIRSFPDEDLGLMVHIPFGGGMDKSMADVVMFHYWNIVYHIGQINYIQTLYGDYEMH